tara:strand:- start:12 stop:305 length:294 start_codon:yes stop_codon:yes gene_type:complete
VKNSNKDMSELLWILAILAMLAMLGAGQVLLNNKAYGATPRTKFYDFSEQLIDGEIKKPTTLYTDSRQEVKFGRLLRLKRNFLGKTIRQTARERVFK